MKKRHVAALSAMIAGGAVCGLVPPPGPSRARAAEATVSFKAEVLPIFEANCVSCHHAPDGQGYKVSGLDLTSYQGVMKGTKYGPMVVPGEPDSSNLMWLLDWRADPELRMPHGEEQRPANERDTIRSWIRQGAKDN